MEVPPVAARPSRGTIRGKRVLVIDDDLAQASVLAQLLVEEGLDATATADPVAAVADYRPHSLDVVIVDLTMPRLSGSEVIAQLRRRQPDLPAILVSGFSADHVRVRDVVALPGVAYLPKPIDVSRVVACLFDLVGLRARASLEPDFRALFEAAPGMVLVIAPDSERTIIAASDGYLAATATHRDELIGRSLFDAFPGLSDVAATGDLAESIARVIATGVADSMPVRRFDLRRHDGEHEERWWSLNHAPVLDRDGNTRWVIQGVEDVTERKRSEQAVRRANDYLISAVDSSQDAFALYDEHDRVVLANSAFRRLFGGDVAGSVTGRRFEELFDAALVAGVFECGAASREEFRAARIAHHHAPSGTLELRTTTGHIVRVLEQRTREGGTVSVYVDVTADVAREDELRFARLEAEAASAAKSEFLSSMSHELRTPLNAILGFAELLQGDRKEPLSPRQLERLGHVLHGGAHLLRLIDDVLDLARIESGRIDVSIAPLDVGQLLREVVSTLGPMAARHQIEMTCSAEVPATVLADRTRASQILMNFGTNAIKYGRPNGHATLEVSRPTSGGVRIAVTDDGVGIPADMQHRIFEPFQRAGQEAGTIEGTGIGLAISRRLASVMSARVGFSSEEGRGSTFWLDLREYVAAEETPVRAPRAAIESPLAGDGSRFLIVYVEDNPSNIAFMRAVIEELPRLELMIARTAEEGLTLIRARRPAAVIMDVHLPGMSGFEATQRLATWPETRSIPVIGLSAAAMATDASSAREAGFRRYLTKPAKLGELVATLEEVLLGDAAA